MSDRLLLNIVYRHLRDPLQHQPECGEHCVPHGCEVRVLDEWMASPVLPSEVIEEARREEMFRAFAEQFNTFSPGAIQGGRAT